MPRHTVPPAESIESGADRQAREEAKWIDRKIKELHSAKWEQSQDPAFVAGYLLGIATAESMLADRGLEL